MSEGTGIQWTDETWNPVTGCNKVSPGCANCYAEGVADRFWAKQYEPVQTMSAEGDPGDRPRRFTDVWTHPDRLDKPLRWTKPRRVFVNSMSDLFHEDVPDEFILDVFVTMWLSPTHTFQVLTKRPERMRDFCSTAVEAGAMVEALARAAERRPGIAIPEGVTAVETGQWRLPNVHLGVSVEDQQRADERIPILLDTPAAVRWVSAEPLLGPVELRPWTIAKHPNGDASRMRSHAYPTSHPFERLDWIVVGGESGPGARPCDVAWIRQIVAACQGASVPVFVKQLGSRPGLRAESLARFNDLYTRDQGMWPEELAGEAWLLRVTHPKGGDPGEWPDALRVREMPTTTPPETTT